jgi:hypothetical protein
MYKRGQMLSNVIAARRKSVGLVCLIACGFLLLREQKKRTSGMSSCKKRVNTMPFKPFVSAPLTTLSEISVIAAKRAFELAVLTYRRLGIKLIPWKTLLIQPVSFGNLQFSRDHQGTALFQKNHPTSCFCL